jgi:hypothetical protein
MTSTNTLGSVQSSVDFGQSIAVWNEAQPTVALFDNPLSESFLRPPVLAESASTIFSLELESQPDEDEEDHPGVGVGSAGDLDCAADHYLDLATTDDDDDCNDDDDDDDGGGDDDDDDDGGDDDDGC